MCLSKTDALVLNQMCEGLHKMTVEFNFTDNYVIDELDWKS